MKRVVLLSLFILLIGINFVSAECVDNDGGENIYEASDSQGISGGFVDGCAFLNNPNGILLEAICKDGNSTNIEITCPSEAPYCNRAVCSSEKPVCTDSDNGNKPYEKGTITEPRNKDGPQHTDYCQDMNTKQPFDEGGCEGDLCGIREYFCTDPYVTTSYQDVNCPAGCKDGVCVEGPTEVPYDCKDSDNGINYFERGVITIGGSKLTDTCIDENKLNELSCYSEKGEKLCTTSGTESGCQTTPYTCPNGCLDGVCIKGELIAEQITCNFINSKEEQKCYLAGSFTEEDEGTKFCSGAGSCIIKFSGYKGEKITWKSSCGGYDYTLMDGVDNNVDFDCGEGESNETEIKDIWFKSAYWQCYDGEEQKSEDDTSCKFSEIWQKYAKEFCDGHCYEDGSKCGVNSFSVSNECYPNLDEIEESTEEPVEIGASLICKNSCPLNEKCYPFGYRKDGKYCSDETNFVDYKEGKKSCENNFECSSNVCVSGECISEGLIKKILNWFSRLFGGE